VTTAGARAGHLHAVDVVRFLTVGGVIVVHATSLTAPAGSDAAGGVLVVLHVTREVFLLLSAFVLAYSARSRPLAPSAFWRRRYPLVVVPYVVWSVIYLLTGGDLGSPIHVIGRLAVDLLDGGAHFHLYFLLLTFQLYLVFPALRSVLVRHPRSHALVLAASAAFELGFTAAVHYGWRPPVLGVWFAHPGSWLASYELYVVAGVIAALHFEAVTAWVRAHTALIVAAFTASVALAVASYVTDLDALAYAPMHAGGVFQPVVVVEAVTATLAQFAVGLRVADHLSARRARQLEHTSDVSFGVYLAHPLLISAILDVASSLGVSAAVGGLPSGLVEAMVVVGLMPFVYAVTLLAVSGLRRTGASLALTGRRARPRAALVTAPAP
jgi:surface polysaccharide O-acyltransferase-like enzyme